MDYDRWSNIIIVFHFIALNLAEHMIYLIEIIGINNKKRLPAGIETCRQPLFLKE